MKKFIALITAAALAIGIAATAATAESAITPPRYTVSVVEEQGEKFGTFVNVGNNVVFGNYHCEVDYCEEQYYSCEHQTLFDIYNIKGELLLESVTGGGRELFEAGGKKFFINDVGEFIYIDLDFVFRSLSGEDSGFPQFVNGLTAVRLRETWKSGAINSQGELVIPAEYDEIFLSDNGLNIVVKRELNPETGDVISLVSGIVNNSGEVVIPLIYDGVFAAWGEHGFVIAWDRHYEAMKYGILSVTGETIIPVEYSRVLPVTSNSFSVSDSEWRWALFNMNGEVVVPFGVYSEISAFDFSRGLIRVTVHGEPSNKHGVINNKGEVVIPVEYSWLEHWRSNWNGASITNGIIIAAINDSWGCIDLNNQVVIPFEYRQIMFLDNDLVRVVDDEGQQGVLYLDGEIVIPIAYQHIGGLEKGLIAAHNHKKWGFINTSGEVVIPFIYDEVMWADTGSFFTGFAIVGTLVGGDEYVAVMKYGAINTKGEIVIPIIYDGINQLTFGFEVRNGSVFEILTHTGEKSEIRFKSTGQLSDEFTLMFIERNVEDWVLRREVQLLGRNDEILLDFGRFRTISYAGKEGNSHYFWTQSGDWFEPQWGIIAVTVTPACCLVCEDKPNAGRRGFVLGGAKITTSDALEILKHIVRLHGNLIDNCDNARIAAAIVGNAISTADALEILKHIVGLTDLTLD